MNDRHYDAETIQNIANKGLVTGFSTEGVLSLVQGDLRIVAAAVADLLRSSEVRPVDERKKIEEQQ